MKNLFKLSAVALLFTLSQGASAAVDNGFDFGPLSPGDVESIGNDYTDVLSDSPTSTLLQGSEFKDTWSFQLAAESNVDSSYVVNNQLGDALISGFSGTLYNSKGALVETFSPSLTADGSQRLKMDLIDLKAGSYSVVIGGMASGNGSSYNGLLNVSPVPEAEEWAMMIVGLGLIGLQARRSKVSSSPTFSIA